MIYFASTRFNNETWEEHEAYRKKREIDGCIYGNRQMIQHKIPSHILMFVIEMNNSTNKIEGIGLIRNTVCTDRYYKIYDNGDFNRYTYKGKYRLGREQLLRFNSKIVSNLDHVLFKGKTHLKRLPGISIVPEKLLKHERCADIDMKKEIENAFIAEFKEVQVHVESPIDLGSGVGLELELERK